MIGHSSQPRLGGEIRRADGGGNLAAPEQQTFGLRSNRFLQTDLAFLALLSALFCLFLNYHAFDGQLSEWDLYLTAMGLWDGYHSGAGVASTIHYGKWHSFGYILLVYALGSPETFAPGDHLFRLMNLLGFWATVLCLPLLWMALALKYGRKVAWPAMAIFIGSPVFLELAGGAHPLLLAMAVLLLGAILLWYPTRGGRGLVLSGLAAIVLCFALMLRLEVALAFPLLVLAPPAGQARKQYVQGCLIRLGATLAACAGFFLARGLILTSDEEKSAEFVKAWYSLENIPIGIVALVLATGIASMIALAWAGLGSIRKSIRSDASFADRLYSALPMAGPLAVTGVTFVFWIANPLPARHFLLFTLAAAIIIALAVAANTRTLTYAMGIAALLIAGNQILSAAVNPYLVHASGFAAHRGWPYLLTAPSGFAWDRREMLKKKWAGSMRAGEVLASGRCGERLIVSAQLSPAVITQIISHIPNVPLRTRTMRYGDHVITMTEVTQPVHALIHTRKSLQDPVLPADVMDDPSLSEFRVAIVSEQPAALGDSSVPLERLASPVCSRIKA